MNHERKPRVTNDYDETSGRQQKSGVWTFSIGSHRGALFRGNARLNLLRPTQVNLRRLTLLIFAVVWNVTILRAPRVVVSDGISVWASKRRSPQAKNHRKATKSQTCSEILRSFIRANGRFWEWSLSMTIALRDSTVFLGLSGLLWASNA